MLQLLLTAGLAIFTAGFLWPVEDAVNGSGLHLVLMWLSLAAVIGLSVWRFELGVSGQKTFRWQLADTGALLLLVGHIVSTIFVFREHGDRRSALNLCFEWCALFVQWMLFRQLALQVTGASKICSSVICSIAVGLAAFGIWQSMVFYPQQADWYRSGRKILDDVQSQAEGVSASEAARVLKEFQAEGIPTEGTSRILWENRLLSSTEPFATFSLANTLAGILALSLVVMLGLLFWKSGHSGERRLWKTGLLILAMLVVAWCLVLTKSRSGWAGALVGAALLFIGRWKSVSRGRLVITGGITALVGCVLFGIAAMSGFIDKEVILESPRSSQFRLMYWTGSLQMLRHQPVFGPGPGNFRNAYLQYRVDEASEEIRDPHNFLLDAWSSAGLIGLLGISLIVISVVRQLAGSAVTMDADPPPESKPKRRGVDQRGTDKRGADNSPAADSSLLRITVIGLLSGFAIHGAWEWLSGATFGAEDLPQLLLLAGIPLAGLFQRRTTSDTFACGAVAMMVHLLAAGGFSMPVVMSLLLMIAAMLVSQRELIEQNDGGSSPAKVRAFTRSSAGQVISHPLVATAACILAAWTTSQWGLVPVASSRHSLAVGNQAFQQRDFERARVEYQRAAELDPFSVSPRQQMAEFEAYRLEEVRQAYRGPKNAEANWEPTEEERIRLQSLVRGRLKEIRSGFEALIQADQRSPFAYRRKAQGLAAVADVLGDQETLNEALAVQTLALNRYPSSIETCVELVRLAETASKNSSAEQMSALKLACDTASRALELDAINHAWGHSDRYLDDQTVSFLKEVVGKSGSSE